MKFKVSTLLLVVAVLVAACGGTKDFESATDTGESAIMEKESSEDTMEEAKPDDDMMKEGDMVDKDESSSDEIMKEDDMMDKDDSSSDEMTTEDDMMDKDDSSNDTVMEESDHDDDTIMEEAGLTLDLNKLPNLGEGWAYEGWLIVNSEPLSSGAFTVDNDGMLSAYTFAVDRHALADATAFVLTLEPVPDSDPAPSTVHILAGDFADDSATLDILHPAALGTGLAEASGSFILGIPTSNSAADSYTSGIWFSSLDLPVLPDGWLYEGWVAGPDGPLSTGRFSAPAMADSDGAGPTAGPNPGPELPGQDYLNPAIDLTTGYAAVISIEPEPDNSPAPFAFKPLVSGNIEDAGDHVPQAFDANHDFPTGTATRDAMAMMEEDAHDDTMMPAVDLPDWFSVQLTDVNTGETFAVADLQGKVVLVETLAVWCSNCLRQQGEVKALHELLGERDDLISLGLDIDPNESDDILSSHTSKHGFDWVYAVAPREVAREIGQLYGDQFLNPPATPMFVIDQHGETHLLPFGIKSADELNSALEPFLSDGI